MTKSTRDLLDDALAQALSLAKEREHRGTGLHADDGRIPCEIAAAMFRVGKIQKTSFAAIEYHHECVRQHFDLIAEAKATYALLQAELDICNHQSS